MDKRIERLFKAKYPTIFRDLYGDPKSTCMAWGFECGDGWARILYNLCANIEHHVGWRREHYARWLQEMRETKAALRNGTLNEYADKTFPYHFQQGIKKEFLQDPEAFMLDKKPEKIYNVVALQIKEKFAGLNFYYQGGDEVVRGMMQMAESMSYRTCEVCGSPGKVNKRGGWMSVRCAKHRRSNDE